MPTDEIADQKSVLHGLDRGDEHSALIAILCFPTGRRTFHLVTPHRPQSKWLEPSTPATTLIVLLNLLAFLALASCAGWVPQIDIDTLVRFGANDRALDEQSWRLLTCAFLHVDPCALLTNMWWLIWTGQIVERRWGSVAFVLCYFACAFGGSLASTLWQPAAVSVGASGAVWGVWGLLTALLICDWQTGIGQSLLPVFFFVALAIATDLCTSSLRPHIDMGGRMWVV